MKAAAEDPGDSLNVVSLVTHGMRTVCLLGVLQKELNNLSSSFISFRIFVSVTHMVFVFCIRGKAQGLGLWETHELDKCEINPVHI